MADKEETVFVVDLSPAMATKNLHREMSDLDYGLKYMFDIITTKMLKGRKTDYVTVVAVHSETTDNPFTIPDENGATAEFTNIEVITNQAQPMYSDLQKYVSKLKPNMSPITSTEGDLFEGFIIAVGLLKRTENLKFKRNIIIITNGETPFNSIDSDLATHIPFAVNNLNIKVIVNGIDFDVGPYRYPNKSGIKQRNESLLQQKLEQFNGHVIMTGVQSIMAINDPPVKIVKPTRLFDGFLRFGCDLLLLESDEFYNFESDPLCLAYQVEMYPALRNEKLIAGHNYEVKEELSAKIKQFREYFIYDKPMNPTNEERKEVMISEQDKVNGFRYSTFDLIELDKDLERATKLETKPGIDVRGFILKEDLPLCYLTEEANYVFPSKSGNNRDIIGFNSFVQSILDLKSYCIARYVQKPNAEVMMVVLIPIIITPPNPTEKRQRGDERIYTFSLIRLPFAEDEKIGKFPDITKIKTTSGKVFESDHPLLPTTENNLLMESFILSMDLDEDYYTESKTNEEESTMNPNFNTTALPLPKPINKPATITEKLTPVSPSIFKYNSNLKKIIIDSAYSGSEMKDCLDKPNLIKTEKLTIESVFNLHNESTENNFIKKLKEKSEDFVTQLIEDFDVHYVEQVKTSNKNNVDNGPAERAEIDDDYDELPDLGALLGVTIT